MNGRMRLLVYPAKDKASAGTLFKALLGVELYIDGPTALEEAAKAQVLGSLASASAGR